MGGVIFNMLSLSTLAQVPATLPDVWVDQVTTPAPYHYTIMDMTGRVMLQGSTPSKAIDIRSLSSGTYWLQIPGTPSQKFLKR